MVLLIDLKFNLIISYTELKKFYEKVVSFVIVALLMDIFVHVFFPFVHF